MFDVLHFQSGGAAPAKPRTTSRDLGGPHAARRPCTPGPTEKLLFRLAMAAAGLWVLDDAFWHREPGTSVNDHLASGVVPVALTGLLALAYPRLRPGARAVAALSAGPLMIVAGVVDGARHVAVDGIAGDDVTAIVTGVGERSSSRSARSCSGARAGWTSGPCAATCGGRSWGWSPRSRSSLSSCRWPSRS
jgi:hypothetical protein